MNKLFWLIVLLLYLLILPAENHAQQAAEIAAGVEIRTIQKITLSPDGIIGEKEFAELTGIAAPLKLTPFQIRQSLEKLLKQYPHIYDIIVELTENPDGGYEVTYNFKKKRFIEKIIIKGNHSLTRDEIQKTIQDKPVEISKSVLKDWTSKIVANYKRLGFFNAQAAGKLVKTQKPDYYDVLIEIKEGKRAKIGSMTFSGDKPLSDFAISFLIGSIKGGMYVPSQVEIDMAAVKDYLTGKDYVMAQVGPTEAVYNPDKNEVLINIPVKTGPKLEIVINGNKSVTSRKVTSLLLFERETGFDDYIIRRSTKAVKNYYRSIGFHFAEIDMERLFPSGNRVKIIVRIDEGEKIRIDGVSFEGNLFIKSKTLVEQMETRDGNFLKPMFFDQSVLDNDISSLMVFYNTNGFLDARISYKLKFSKKSGVKVIVIVEEGLETRIGKIIFEGNHLISGDEILKATAERGSISTSKIKQGEAFQESLLMYDVPNIIKYLYSRRGYVYTAVNVETTFREEKKFGGITHAVFADLKYTINQDRVSIIGGVTLKLGEKVKRYVIMREILFAAGDVYDYEKVFLSKQNLYRLGLFKRVSINTTDGENRYIKNIVISVQESKAGFGGIGAGYANRERLKGFFELGYNNLWGTARRLKFRGEWSTLETRHSIDYLEPWFTGQKLDARVAAVLRTKERDAYRLRQGAVSFALEKSFSKYLKSSMGYRFEANDLVDVEPGAILSSEDVGRLNIASINPSLVRDSRDDPFNPTSGSVNSIAFQDAARILGSQVQLVKVSGRSYWYYSPWKGVVIASGSSLGAGKKFGATTEVPLSERFFIGGRSSVRGYKQDRLIIPGKTFIKGSPTGGNIMLQLNTEVRIALPFNTGIVLFVDGGQVWASISDMDMADLKFSVGTGFRYDTIVGPLRLDYGYKLDKEPDYTETDPVTGASFLFRESRSEIHFTLGHAF